MKTITDGVRIKRVSNGEARIAVAQKNGVIHLNLYGKLKYPIREVSNNASSF